MLLPDALPIRIPDGDDILNGLEQMFYISATVNLNPLLAMTMRDVIIWSNKTVERTPR